MEETFIVICRDDTAPDGTPGEYVLATRRVFGDRNAAIRYADTVARGREPLVVPGDWRHLRPAASDLRHLRVS